MRRDGRPASRRSIVAGTLSGAVLGLCGGSAQADDALSADAVRIPINGSDIGGFRAMPARTGPFGCVVVVGEDAGLPEWIAAACRRLAGARMLAIAADAWAGPGEPSDELVMKRLDAAFLLGRQHSGEARRQALVGFGRGGRVTWLYTAQNSELKAAAAWGGAIDGPTSAASPRTPLDVAGQLQAPLLGLYGQGDASNPRAVLFKAEAAAGRRLELVVYDSASAEFWVEGRSTDDLAASVDGWVKLLAWFKRCGVGGAG